MPPEQPRPKILLVTRNLPPLLGGMERLVQHLALGLVEYSQLTVIGPKGCTSHLPAQVRVLESPSSLAPFLLCSTWLSLKACRQEKFDIIIGGSGLTAPTLYFLSLIHGSTTAVFLHGLDLVVDNFLYKRIFLPCIRRINLAIVNSHNTRRLAVARGVQQKRTVVINPGTDLPEMTSNSQVAAFRARHKIPFNKIIIFVGRITRRKGLSAFIRNSLPEILEAEPDAGLLVVGENPSASLNKLGEQEEVMREIGRSQYQQRIVFLGHLSDEELPLCYASADVQVLPLVSVAGDVEGFGMIAVEAAACGTPTIAFDLGGVSDAISVHSGQLIPAGDHQQMSSAVITTLREQPFTEESCIGHARNYSWDTFHDKVKSALAPFLRN